MPAWVKDEGAWKKAKAAAAKSKGKAVEELGDADWGLVTHIYQQMTKSTTLDTLKGFLQKARRRLSDENPDVYEEQDEDADPDSNMYSETDVPDEASQWLAENDKKQEKAPEYSEYEPDEDEEAHQTEAKAVPAAAPAKKVAPSEDELQPSREEIAQMREYTRPWEQRARDRAKLEARPEVNPGKHAAGRIIEARNTSHADYGKALREMEASPDYQNADPITQMEMNDKFKTDWHQKNPEHLIGALKAHDEAHKAGKKAKDLFDKEKDEKIKHIATGGVQPGAYSTEEGLQHAGGSRDEEEGTPGGISQDPSTTFAQGNQAFLEQYMKDYDKKPKKFADAGDLDTYDQGSRANIESVLGEHPALKDKAKKRQFDKFVERYHPLFGKAAKHVLAKMGLTEKANRGEIDHGLLHEAATHALFQAVNDYDHDHPSKAKFTTHLNRKMHGLMQTALKTQQSEIPETLRDAKRQYDAARAAENAGPARTLSPEEIKSQASTFTAPGEAKGTKKPAPTPLVTKRPSVQDIATKHPPEVQDRLKRVAAARAPLVRPKAEVKPRPAAPAGPVRNVRNVNMDEGGEE